MVDVEQEYIELLELKKDLTKKLHKTPKSKILKRAIADCSADIRKLVKEARKNNTKEYKKLIHTDSSRPNEMDFFKTKMSNAEQRRIMSQLKEVNQFMGIDKPYRLALLNPLYHPNSKHLLCKKSICCVRWIHVILNISRSKIGWIISCVFLFVNIHLCLYP